MSARIRKRGAGFRTLALGGMTFVSASAFGQTAAAPAGPPSAPPVAAAPEPRVPPREALRKGLEQYRAGDFEAAASRFAEAEAGAADAKLDPAVARYDRALALTQAGKTEEAAKLWAEAQRTPDLGLQAQAWYNDGLARSSAAEKQAQAQKLQEAVEGYRGALDAYERALTLASADRDSKINHELASRRLKKLEEELKKQQQQQKQPQQNKQQPDLQKQDQQKQDQPKQDQNKRDQQKPQQDRQKSDQQKQQGQQPQPPPPQTGEEKESQPQQGPPRQVEDKPEAAAGQPKEAAPKPGELSKDQVKAMLEAQQMEEDALREAMRKASYRPDPNVEKDW